MAEGEASGAEGVFGTTTDISNSNEEMKDEEEVKEVSAFDDEAETKKQRLPKEVDTFAMEELQRMALLKESRRYRSALTLKMLPLAIDYQAVAYFFKSLKTIPDNEGFTLADAVSIMTQLIIAEWSQSNGESQTNQLMCLRGLLALIHNENFGDYDS